MSPEKRAALDASLRVLHRMGGRVKKAETLLAAARADRITAALDAYEKGATHADVANACEISLDAAKSWFRR